MSAAVLSIPLLKELHTESRPERRFEFSPLSLCCCWPLFSCIGPTLKEPFNVMSCKWFGHRSLHAATEHNAYQYDLIETTPQSSQGLVLRHISDNEMISRTEDSLFNVQEGVKVPFLDPFRKPDVNQLVSSLRIQASGLNLRGTNFKLRVAALKFVQQRCSSLSLSRWCWNIASPSQFQCELEAFSEALHLFLSSQISHAV